MTKNLERKVMIFFKNLFSRKSAPIRNNRISLNLENLDHRIVPAVRTWNPVGGSTDANVAANWGGTAITSSDTLVIGSGKGSIDFSSVAFTTIDTIQVASGFTNTITTGTGGLTIQDGYIKSGTVFLNGTLTLDGLGMQLGDTGTFDVVDFESSTAKKVEVSANGGVYIYGVNFDDSTGLKILQGGVAEVKKSLDFNDVAGNAGTTEVWGTLIFDDNTVYSGGERDANPSDIWWANEIINYNTGTLQFSGTADVYSWIKNSGTMTTTSSETVTIYGMSTGQFMLGGAKTSLLCQAGTVKLLSDATLVAQCTGSQVRFLGGSLKVQYGAGASGAKSAYLTCPTLIFDQGTLIFEDDVATGSRSGQLDLSCPSTNVFFTNGSTYQVTLNFTNGVANKLICNNVYAAGVSGSATNSVYVNKVGTQPLSGSWKILDATTKHDDFTSWLIGGLNHTWTSNDLYVYV